MGSGQVGQDEPALVFTRLQQLLRHTAETHPDGHLDLYSLQNTHKPTRVTYADLYSEAYDRSLILRQTQGFEPGKPVVLCFHDHRDAITWFWAVLLADGLPVQSSPASLSNGEENREKHLRNITEVLDSPMFIIRERDHCLFQGHYGAQVHTVESLSVQRATPTQHSEVRPEPRINGSNAKLNGSGHQDETAMLMLTSGSTGAPKAACLTHKQVLAAVAGKASVRTRRSKGPFLNWVGLDHVASLVEIHIQALWLGVSQVHVHAADVVASPLLFLDLLHRHQVVTSFAPNFFLAKLLSAVGSAQSKGLDRKWDLSSLTLLASGGEANDVDICVAVSALLSRYGAPRNVLTPGFGMTETCAGAIFNVECPDYDARCHYNFASLGRCMPGVEMRVVVRNDSTSFPASSEQEGELQLRGPVIFPGYYHNPEATAGSFTEDGWFRTGDQALIDKQGHLRIIGRTKDVVNINGIKISGTTIQDAVEKALQGLVGRVVAFPARAVESHTEQIMVAYTPRLEETADPITIQDRAFEATVLCCGSTPVVFSLPSDDHMNQSSLGKVSRHGMRSLFEAGTFDPFIREYEEAIQRIRIRQEDPAPASAEESLMLEKFMEVTDSSETQHWTVNTSLFEAGCTSMDFIRLKRKVDEALGTNVPIIIFVKNPTARKLAAALENHKCHSGAPYNPVVTLHPGGSKTPLWLVHPGVGEVLVFVGLAKQLSTDDRPIYALRARGFEPGQAGFGSVTEAVSTYHSAIKATQPSGPYAIAGYSYGAMLAFETAKVLEASGDEVSFLASFNLPPHIGARMRQLSWPLCLLHLCYFLGLCTEDFVEHVERSEVMRDMSDDEAREFVLKSVDKDRMVELGQDEANLAAWAHVAFGLQRMATQYEPSGRVTALDVFHAIPLKTAASSREDWLVNHLSRWQDFCETTVRFHCVGGAHYTMIGQDHVVDFAETLRSVMRDRGL